MEFLVERKILTQNPTEVSQFIIKYLRSINFNYMFIPTGKPLDVVKWQVSGVYNFCVHFCSVRDCDVGVASS